MTTAINPQDGRTAEPLLNIENLKIAFESTTGVVEAVRDFDLTIYPGQSVAIVGESGSGKSVSMLAVMGLLPDTATVTADEMTYDGQDMLAMTDAQRRRLIGRENLRAVCAALDELPAKTRSIFLMNRIENISHRSIARIYGMTDEAVYYHIRRALEHLAQLRDEMRG